MRLLQLALLAGGFAATALGGRETSFQRHLDSPVQHHPIAVDAAGYAIVDKATHGRISKRWLGAPRDANLWPQKTVRFCYETQGCRDRLHVRFKVAMKLWRTVGLGADQYKMIEVADPGISCTSHNERATILVIECAPASSVSMWAHVGMPVVNAAMPGDYVGPVAHLSDRDILPAPGAMKIAHEIGHVWGLKHESQYVGFWCQPYNIWPPGNQAESEAATAFGKTFESTCKNIIGYADAVRRVEADTSIEAPEIRDLVKRRLCQIPAVARKYEFKNARDILPLMSPSAYRSPHAQGVSLGRDSVDFQSVMLYSSDAFSSNGKDTLVGNDGSKHYEGQWPSEADVFGIKTLYRDAELNGRPAPILPNNRLSARRRVWLAMQTHAWCLERDA